MNKDFYNKHSLIKKILADRYNIYNKNKLGRMSYAKLNALDKNNTNRAIEDSNDECNY